MIGFSSKVEESYFKLIIWVEYVVITDDQRGISTKIENHISKSSAKKNCITVLIFLLYFSQSLPLGIYNQYYLSCLLSECDSPTIPLLITSFPSHLPLTPCHPLFLPQNTPPSIVHQMASILKNFLAVHVTDCLVPV